MNIEDFKNIISSLISHIFFDFNGKACGIDPLSRTEFDVWYGDTLKTVKSVDEVMKVPIFDGKPLEKIFNSIENIDF